MDLKREMQELAKRAKDASHLMSTASAAVKAKALTDLSQLLLREEASILAANAQDVQAAETNHLDSARLDRLRLSPKIIQDMAQACLEVAAMDDPVGGIESMTVRPSGIMVGKMRVPLGVVAMIYESRPNVTVDAAILCLKAGNAVVLRGGSEALHSNLALAARISKALTGAGLPGVGVQLVPTTDREAVKILLKLDDYIDVVIPRGGEGLIRAVVAEATMPVLKHYKGVCHIFVDEQADLDLAVPIIHNAKVQRPATCNSLECLLVHQTVAGQLLPKVSEILGAAGVTFHACPRSLALLGSKAVPAKEEDWGMEYLSLDLAVKIVSSQDEAQEHIRRFGSNHSEAILTRDYSRAMRFVREVDASAVLVNASTRLNDGGQFGLGAEIGISTSKLHAYGPMGVKELTSTKFVVLGQGQIRN